MIVDFQVGTKPKAELPCPATGLCRPFSVPRNRYGRHSVFGGWTSIKRPSFLSRPRLSSSRFPLSCGLTASMTRSIVVGLSAIVYCVLSFNKPCSTSRWAVSLMKANSNPDLSAISSKVWLPSAKFSTHSIAISRDFAPCCPPIVS